MLERKFSGMDWYSRSESGLAREQIAAVARHLARWMSQLIVCCTVVAGLASIGSAVVTHSVVEPTESVPARGGPVRVVESVAVSPDGTILAACGCNDLVRIWDISRLGNGPSLEPVLLQHNSQRHAVAFSPDGSLLGTAGNGSVAIWSRKSTHFKVLLERETETSRCVAFAPDGRTLAVGMDDGSVRLWDLPGGHERAVIPAHDSVVRSIAFSADGQRLVSSGQDAKVVLSDAVNGVCIRRLEQEPRSSNQVLFIAFSPNGHTLAVGEVGVVPADVTLRDSHSGAIIMRLTGHKAGVHALAFSPDGRILATAGIDSCIKLWDVITGNELTTFPSGDTLVKAIAFSPDGAWLAFGAGEAMVRVWEVGHQRSYLLGQSHSPVSTTTNPGRTIRSVPTSDGCS
jgi:WD40 repeat protein